MQENSWRRYRSTRRGFLRGIGVAAGALTLAPAIAACGGLKRNSRGSTVGSAGAGGPVKGGTLTSSLAIDVSNLDYAFAADGWSPLVIGNCVEPLLTVDSQGQPVGLLATNWENPDDHAYVFKLRQ